MDDCWPDSHKTKGSHSSHFPYGLLFMPCCFLFQIKESDLIIFCILLHCACYYAGIRKKMFLGQIVLQCIQQPLVVLTTHWLENRSHMVWTNSLPILPFWVCWFRVFRSLLVQHFPKSVIIHNTDISWAPVLFQVLIWLIVVQREKI